MDAKVIILLVFILFGMIVAYMVANGMVDLTSIFSRVTKSQAQESLGGVKLEVVSPVPGVYYDATGNQLDLTDIVKITGKNLNGKALTISVATKYWTLDLQEATYNTDWGTYSSISSGKTIQVEFGKELYYDSTNKVWMIVDEDYYASPANGDVAYKLYLVRDTSAGVEPFDLPEFVELIFAVGETAKAEVTIVAEP